MNVTFRGVAREVTSSCFLVETGAVWFLVGCGMVQRGREAAARNRKRFPDDSTSIDFMLLPHARVDHSALLPKLTRASCCGPVHTTAATTDLLKLMLPDSAYVQKREPSRLYHLHRVTREGCLRDINVFVDSPMANEVTRITQLYMELFDESARRVSGWRSLSQEPPYLHFTQSVEECMALNQIRLGAIIISASGTCTAGCTKHHLRHSLRRRECSAMTTGFQARGTPGRGLIDGARRARIFGEDVPVRALIPAVGSPSAHANHPALPPWAADFKRPPRKTFPVRGEVSTTQVFAGQLCADRRWHVTVPEPRRRVECRDNGGGAST